MTVQRQTHTATLLPSGKVFITGGWGGAAGGLLSTAELYDPGTGMFTATSMTVGRDSHTATLLPNGKVLIAGGYGTGVAYASAELYDPAVATWAPAGSMVTAREYHTATLLPSGQVLIVGGLVGSSWLASAELYTSP
jgi:hypothetical protein